MRTTFDIDAGILEKVMEVSKTKTKKGAIVIAKENALTILHHDNHLKLICREMGIKTVDFLS